VICYVRYSTVLFSAYVNLLLVLFLAPMQAYAQNSLNEREGPSTAEGGWDRSKEILERPTIEDARKHPAGVLIAGAGTLASSYGSTLVMAIQLRNMDQQTCVNCNKAGVLFAPIAGPFIFMATAVGTEAKVISAAFGVLQSAGLSLALLGAVVCANGVPGDPGRKRRGYVATLELGAVPLRGGGLFTVRFAF
jgi:ABC-type spermidine/putrescine transport system permease subunit II